MRKKLYLFPVLLLGFFLFTITSCLNTTNDNVAAVDQEWKTLNESRFAKVAGDNSYNVLSATSDVGKVYWQKSTEITDFDNGIALRTTVEGRPEFTDTVVVRYEGWFFDKEGNKIIFDSTENPSLRSQIDYRYGAKSSTEPNHIRVKFPVNQVLEGWTTILQDMKIGDERVVCIPQELGYASTVKTHVATYDNGQTVSNAPSFTIIPAYTTLWYRLKLYKLIPMKGIS